MQAIAEKNVLQQHLLSARTNKNFRNFIYSFFYKLEKRKVYKEHLDSFTSAKVRLDEHLSKLLKSAMLSKINEVVGKRCDNFVNKIEGEKIFE